MRSLGKSRMWKDFEVVRAQMLHFPHTHLLIVHRVSCMQVGLIAAALEEAALDVSACCSLRCKSG